MRENLFCKVSGIINRFICISLHTTPMIPKFVQLQIFLLLVLRKRWHCALLLVALKLFLPLKAVPEIDI